jgi:O-antigen/teichoic acid export membrane protein
VAQIAATFAMLGFGPLAVREVPRRLATGDRAGAAMFTRFALVTTTVLSLAIAAGIALMSSNSAAIPPHYRMVVGLSATLVPPLALIVLLRGVAQGHGNVAGAQVPGELARPAIMVCAFGGAALLGFGASEHSYMVSATAAAALAALTSCATVWRIAGMGRAAPLPAGARREWTAKALPFLGLGLVAMLQGEINTLLLGWLAGPEEAGLFQPIARLMPLLTLPVQAAGMGYAPHVAELWERNDLTRLRQVTGKFTVTTTVLTALTALVLAFAGPWLMLAFGSEFRVSAPLLWYAAGAQIFSAACGPFGILFSMTGQTKLAVVGQMVGLLPNIMIGLILIPAYGAAGAVTAWTAGIITWNLFLLFISKRLLQIDPSILSTLHFDRWKR